MFLWFELYFDLLTCINRLDNGINLSTEITELVSYRICRFLVVFSTVGGFWENADEQKPF